MRAQLALLSVAAGLAVAQDFGTVAQCGQTCFTNMKVKIPGCAPDNQKCHCDFPDYRNGLRDCVSQACAAADVPLVQTSLAAYVDGVCAAAAAAPSSAPATSAAPTASSAPSSSPAPPPASSSVPPTTTSAAPSSSPTPARSSASVTSAAAPSSTSTSTHPSSSSTSASASSTTATSSSTSTPAAAAEPGTNAKSEGLSSATVAGIAIGSAAVGLGLIGVLVCVFLHRRNRNRDASQGANNRLNISQPMPGSGRSYAGDHHNEKYDINSSNEDFKSRRYEDMLPRQTPRTMV